MVRAILRVFHCDASRAHRMASASDGIAGQPRLMGTRCAGNFSGWSRDERGQGLAEYCLITALIALVALGIFWHVSGGLQGGWGTANTALASGNAGTTQTTPSSGAPSQ